MAKYGRSSGCPHEGTKSTELFLGIRETMGVVFQPAENRALLLCVVGQKQILEELVSHGEIVLSDSIRVALGWRSARLTFGSKKFLLKPLFQKWFNLKL